MKFPFEVWSPLRPAPPALLTVAARLGVGLAVVAATAASVWLGDNVSSTLPPTYSRTAQPAPRHVTLPTVVVVGKRDAQDLASRPLDVSSAAVSSLNPQDLATGRVKFRQ